MNGRNSSRSTRTTSSRPSSTDRVAPAAEPSGYREFAPRPELGELVACVWERAAGAGETRVLPDGCIDVVAVSDGPAFLAGPDTGPVVHVLRPGTTVTGVRFRVGAAGVALGLDANELRNQRVTLDALWGRGADELGERVAGAGGTAGRLTVLQDVVAGRSEDVARPDPLVLEAVRRLGLPGARVAAVGEELGLSERELRRRVRRAVGYGPKMLDRVLRFRRFLRTAEVDGDASSSLDLAETAFALGYADQAHLTRECSALAGLPPTRLL